MTYLWELYKDRDYHIEPTLERIRRAVEHIGYPQRHYVSVQVGGTNGKGSTCAFLESILRKHGYKTGWFVSPHLVREEERWRINSTEMDSHRLKDYVKELKDVFERFSLTYFEAATLIALQYFKDEKIDIAVFEVGMGGRWDATKVCEPIAVGITNVERDHTRWLGKNLWDIALEKIELYRKSRPLIIGSTRYPLYPVAIERAEHRDLRVAGIDYEYLGRVDRDTTILERFVSDALNMEAVELSLWGRWQIDNASMAIALSKEIMELREKSVREALQETKWEGRMEIVRRNPPIILDGAHNPYAVEKVISEITRHISDINILFTGLKEKEWQESMKVIRKFRENILLAEVSHHRAESLNKMLEEANRLGFRNVGVLNLQTIKDYDKPLLAIGSLYLVGEIKRSFILAPDKG